jgi:hypothetical protein
MPVMRNLEVPPGDARYELAMELDKWLWLDEVRPVQEIGTGRKLEWVEVAGLVVAIDVQEGPLTRPADQAAAYALARSVRLAMVARAEEAISAAERAGWKHLRHPQIDVAGDIWHPERDKPDVLACECRVRMTLARA